MAKRQLSSTFGSVAIVIRPTISSVCKMRPLYWCRNRRCHLLRARTRRKMRGARAHHCRLIRIQYTDIHHARATCRSYYNAATGRKEHTCCCLILVQRKLIAAVMLEERHFRAQPNPAPTRRRSLFRLLPSLSAVTSRLHARLVRSRRPRRQG